MKIMTKISAEQSIDCKLQIIGCKDIDITLNNSINDYSIEPYKVEKDGIRKYLIYSVHKNGKTLRQFINDLNELKPKRSFRQSFRKQLIMYPTDLLIQLIDACDYLLSNNILTIVFVINESNKFK